MNCALLVALALALTGSALAEPSGDGRIRFVLTDLRSSSGVVRCSLFAAANADAFPLHPDHAVASADAPIHDRRAICEFAHLPPGDYAVASFHDENNNGRLDATAFRIPKEGVAVSNNARVFFGPPRWKDARFAFPGGTLEVTAKMRY